eukprot:2035780-Prymnesium_polylepis.2
MEILTSNEAAKLKKLDELGERLNQRATLETPADGDAGSQRPAVPAPEAEESFDGFDELSVQAAERGSSG